MIPPYKKIAKGVLDLTNNLEILGVRMPLGLDGLVVEELIQYSFEKSGRVRRDDYGDFLAWGVQMSSKSDEFDSEKFRKILSFAEQENAALYAIDMRTQTGSLGKKFWDEVHKWRNQNEAHPNINRFSYGVVFDANRKADIRGSDEDLTDDERPKWVDGKEKVNQLIHKEELGLKRIWQYNVTHDIIDRFDYVSEIKREIDNLILEEKERDVIKRPELSL